MKKRTVNGDSILEAAVSIAEEKGLPGLTMQELAVRLDIKPASLYNHVSGIKEVQQRLAAYAYAEFEKLAVDQILGYAKEEALMRFAIAMRRFAEEHLELYKAIMVYGHIKDVAFKNGITEKIFEPYHLEEEMRTHFARAFRSAMYGFVYLETNGAWEGGIDAEESYLRLINQIIKMLEVYEDG